MSLETWVSAGTTAGRVSMVAPVIDEPENAVLQVASIWVLQKTQTIPAVHHGLRLAAHAAATLPVRTGRFSSANWPARSVYLLAVVVESGSGQLTRDDFSKLSDTL